MGGYSFFEYPEPCPNCQSVVRGSWFAGDHYDDPSYSIYCSNAKCDASFKRDLWEQFGRNATEKIKITARSGGI